MKVYLTEQKHKAIMITCSIRDVLVTQGTTQLLLILSFAHSHAKYFVNWFKAAANIFGLKKGQEKKKEN